MEIQLLRHATLIVRMGGHEILVDPMFAAAGATDAIANTPNQRRNPLLDLPFDDEVLAAYLAKVDAVIVTHTHNDHWDQRARDLLPKSLPVFCQPEDVAKIEGADFVTVEPVVESLTWKGLQMEAINHCLLSRDALRQAVDEARVGERVWILGDGEKKTVNR